MLRRIFPCQLSKQFFCSTTANDLENAERISVKTHRRVALIGIDRPAKRNALNKRLVDDLRRAVDDFEKDDNLLAAVLYGEGGNFCSGYDLEELSKSESIPEHFINNDLTAKYVRKPMIAAINGYAVGFGLDLALWCDLRIMDETAVLGCFGRRYGASMSEFGIARLNAAVGLSKAMDMVLTSRNIKSQEALDCGLINRVVDCGTVIGRALSLGDDLAKFRRAALLTDRAMLYKHAFARIPLKNSVIDEDSVQHREQILKDIKKGAKIFEKGAGKHGILFSQYLWDKV